MFKPPKAKKGARALLETLGPMHFLIANQKVHGVLALHTTSHAKKVDRGHNIYCQGRGQSKEGQGAPRKED